MAITYGTSASETVTGTSGADTLYGYASTGDSISTDNDTLVGLAGNDKLYGGQGNDSLIGGDGIDTLFGGLGNDTYVVTAGDIITEAAGAGTDIIESSITWTLAANVENLELTGSTAINGTGNTLLNTITGNSANNILNGGGDALADILDGAAGDDTYLVNTGDKVNDTGSSTGDTVKSSVTWSLTTSGAGIEKLTLTGTSSINGTGNALANTITGNSANNILAGSSVADAAADTLIGGLGNDTYIVYTAGDTITELSGQGTDTVSASFSYTLASANVENLTLTGASAINGTGNDVANKLTGNSANNTLTGGGLNDTLVGGLGNDTLLGGTGNDSLTGDAGNDSLDGGADDDTYVVGTGDIVNDTGSTTGDTVNSSVTWSLATSGTGIEKLTLTGTSAINGTGNASANTITGNSANNILNGGSDSLADTLKGGLGNDTYVVSDSNDTITESLGQGTDTVSASANYSLASLANVENLTLTGSAISGTGNGLANVLTGNSASNSLDGGALNDTLIGGSGNDTLLGGSGNDSLNGGAGTDSMSGGIGDDIYLVDASTDVIVEAASEGSDTVQSSVNYSLASLTNVENLTLTGAALIGTGNSLANTLIGNASNNTLDSGGDTVSDAFYDIMKGGLGDDTYLVRTVNDSVIESLAAGTDTVKTYVSGYTLAANVEKLTLMATGTGTGNTLNNTLTVDSSITSSTTLNGLEGNDSLIGGTGADTLNGGAGNDSLNGGSGIDSMDGGIGDDIYVVDNLSDAVTDAAGTDTVQASISGYNLAADVEKLILTGTVASGTGNALNNTLTGNGANNTLNGGTGNDTLIGGLGNDTYTVDSTLDVVTEAASAGTDTVSASATYSLASVANVENLTLTGTAVNGTGNSLANTIIGNGSANVLTGGAGADILTGNGAADTFDFNFLSEMGLGSASDKISDFVSGTDKIDLSGIDLDTVTAGDQTTFTFLSDVTGVTDFTNKVTFDGTNHVLNISTDADSAAEYQITLTGVSSFDATTDLVA